LSTFSNIFLIIFKLIIGFFSGSTSVLSDGIHSLVDFGTSVCTLSCVKISDKPADKQHNYGHAKIDSVSGLISGIFILVTGILIIIIAINKIICPTPITHVDIAFITMIASGILNLVISLYLNNVAKQYNSIALEGEALHKFTDVWSSLGIALSLFLVWLTHFVLLDSIISIIVGLYICYESFDILKQALNSLLDHSLPKNELDQITNVLNKYKDNYNNYYDLKTRKSGNKRYIEMKINVNDSLTMSQVSILCQSIEKDINQILKDTDVIIQIESNYNNKVSCRLGKNRLKMKIIYKNF
jgi:cation diffusion facilitator family transporter